MITRYHVDKDTLRTNLDGFDEENAHIGYFRMIDKESYLLNSVLKRYFGQRTVSVIHSPDEIAYNKLLYKLKLEQ